MTAEQPLRVVSLESRHEDDMVRLLERHDCAAIRAPSLREVALEDQREALAFGEQLVHGACDVLVLLTGVGMRLLVDALQTRYSRDEVLAALAATSLVCRGPKPVAVLKELGLRAAAVAPEPNTWQDLLGVIDARVPVAGKRVFVQEFGRLSPMLLSALRERGAHTNSVSVYAWAMPEDTGPLCRAVQALCAGEADAVLFTSGKQIEHLMQAAAMVDAVEPLMAALARDVVVASVGPMTTEALNDAGLRVDIEPEHPKMGHLVLAIARDGARVLADKRARQL